ECRRAARRNDRVTERAPSYAHLMYRAVHADRAGRILVADHAALAFDGARFVPLADAIPLPPDAVVVPIEREGLASERSGKPRRMGAGRLAAAALLPPGHLRTLPPAYVDATDRPALPLAAPANERAPAAVALKRDGEAEPTEVAAFHPTTDEVAGAALAHFAAGGTMVAFGRACEGEALLAAREIEDASGRIREGAHGATIHLNTNGSVPAGLRRVAAAGVDSVCFRLVSARASAYDALHRPEGYRFADVRASIRVASDLGMSVSILVLVLPGLFDQKDELDALIEVAGD